MVAIIKAATGETAEPKTPRKRSPGKAAIQKASGALLEAIDFVTLASDPDSKMFWPQYGRIVNGWIVAGNGQLCAGHSIESELTLCPHLGRLREAIKRAGASLSMSALENDRLSIAGGGFKAIVPCMKGEELPPAQADMNVAVINDAIREGFKAVLSLAREDAETVVESSLLLRANTVVGTNRNLLLEYWHGVDLPPGLAVPHGFCKAIVKTNKTLVGFGWSEGRSITFYFDNGSWISTRLKSEQWPNVDTILNAEFNGETTPEKLFEGLEAVASFSTDGAVHFLDEKLKSTYGSAADGGPVHGASFDVPGLKGTHHFSAKLLKLAIPAAKLIDYTTHEDRMLMYNQDARLRGVLTKRKG